jgi:tryptophan 2,3-dioxygenase
VAGEPGVPLVTAPVLPTGGRRSPGAPVRAGTPAAAEAALTSEIGRWLARDTAAADLDALALAQALEAVVRWHGLHHLPEHHLAALDAARSRHRGRDLLLDGLLDSALAKRDGRYWNRTYLCLAVLERAVEGPVAPVDPIALAALLAADIVRDELDAVRRDVPVGELGRPDGRGLRARIGHAMRFAAANLGAEVAADVLDVVAHAPESGLPAVLELLPAPPVAWVGPWLDVTVLPVSTVHDERFFIRALQAHEMVFTAAARRVALAVEALRADEAAEAARRLRQVTALVDRGQSLFRMVATMRTVAFHTFRDRTDGASAIQSEQYKRFELRCAPPTPERATSAAFQAVPAVQAEAAAGVDTVVDAWLDLRRRRPDHPAAAELLGAMRALEQSHGRWKATHVTLAARMLGDARGSGYTAGVPYLRRWADHPLFGALPAVAAALGTPKRQAW